MKLHYLLIFSLILVSQFAIAAHIQKVKDKKTLIVLDGMSVSEGDTLFALDSETNKKTAILTVTKVKGDKAIAEITKGKAKVDQEVQIRGAAPSDMPTSRKDSPPRHSNSTFAVGGLFGIGFDTMKINIGAPVESITQTGMGFSLLGAVDFKLNDWFSIRGLAGMEQFNVKGESKNHAICTSCETKITYFSGMGWARLHVVESVWLGAGLGIAQPMSKETNALDTSTIASTTMYAVGGGADVAIGENMYFPVQLEYGMQPPSDSVKTSYYSVRLGVMLRY
jgi:opacity protein-like surface antigen